MIDPVSTPSIEVVRGIPPAQRARTAAIYLEAFGRKFSLIWGVHPDAQSILETSMHLDNAFIALRDGQVVGVVGFHHDHHKLVAIQRRTLIATFGLISGTARWLLNGILARIPRRRELLLDGIAVHADARGQGVGTLLLNAIFAFAAEHGYERIRLDVIDTNPRARQLYERLGFVPVRTIRVPFAQSLGFRAITEMVYKVQAV